MAGGLPEDRSAPELDLYPGDFASLVEMPLYLGDWNPSPFFTVPNFLETHSDPKQDFNNVSRSAGSDELSTLGTSSNPIDMVDSNSWSAPGEIPQQASIG